MAKHDRVIYLIGASSYTQDSIGNQVPVPTSRKVSAKELYVGSSEFYNAAVTGLRPEKRFEIYTREYQAENKLSHGGITYRIIRTETRGEKTRLTCERVVADG